MCIGIAAADNGRWGREQRKRRTHTAKDYTLTGSYRYYWARLSLYIIIPAVDSQCIPTFTLFTILCDAFFRHRVLTLGAHDNNVYFYYSTLRPTHLGTYILRTTISENDHHVVNENDHERDRLTIKYNNNIIQ